MEDKKVTAEIVFILDKSGSMSGTESDTAGGFNSLIEKQKEEFEKAWVTTWFFSEKAQLLHDRVPIQNIKPMNLRDINIGGNTALYDAVGFAIYRIESIQRRLREEDRPDFTLFAIMTDGYENASRHLNNSDIRELIEKKKKDGWEFLFMAAGIDAQEEAEKISISNSYQMDDYCAPEAFAETSRMISSMKASCLKRPNKTKGDSKKK